MKKQFQSTRIYYGSAKIIKENSIYWHRKIFKMYTQIFILDSKVKNQVAKQNVYYNIIFPKKRNKKVRHPWHWYYYSCTLNHKVRNKWLTLIISGGGEFKLKGPLVFKFLSFYIVKDFYTVYIVNIGREKK